MDQSYCADHFLDECEAYYRAERVRFEELKAAIQDAFPARRSARGKLPNRTRTGGHQREEITSTSAEAEIAKLKEHRKRLGLHRSLRTFRGEIGGTIWDCARDPGASDVAAWEAHMQGCPFLPRAAKSVVCRYCDFESRMPQLVAPIAPMYSIPKTVFTSKQCGSIYGITFTVDVCSGRGIITLHSMICLDSLYCLPGKTPLNRDGEIPKKKQLIEKLGRSSARGSPQIPKQDRAEASVKKEIENHEDSSIAPKKRKLTKPPSEDENTLSQRLKEKPSRNTTTLGKRSSPTSPKEQDMATDTKKIKTEYSDDIKIKTRKRRNVPSDTD